MNLHSIFIASLLGGALTPALADQTFKFDYPVFADVGDGNSIGVGDSRLVSIGSGQIVDVNVSLQLSGRGSGAWNGDIYAYLAHDSGFSVLLNRAGRRTGGGLSEYGYGDNGFDIVLDDEAPQGDVHLYRLTLSGDHDRPVVRGILNGTWAPDGREVDPDDSLIETPRTAPLGVFDGLKPDGFWYLFVADLSSGGTIQLTSWSLELTLAVPESPTVLAIGPLLVFVGAGLWVRRRKLARVAGKE